MDVRLPPGIATQGLQPPLEIPAFSHAFQPIIDTVARKVFSQEVLIRGTAGEPAYRVLAQVAGHDKYQFDQDNRVSALALAAKLGLDCHINLNFLPQGLYVSADSISSTIDAAARHGLPARRIILEVTEGEVIADHAHFAASLNQYRALGMKVAIDDFGAGYSGLNLLADFQPDQVKIDMHLVRGIEAHGARQSIVRAIIQVCADLGIDLIAEGVETVDEYLWFADQGVRLYQGYLFARPAFEAFPDVHYP